MRRNLSLETDFGLSLFMVANAEIAFDKLAPYTSKCDVTQTSVGNFTVTMEIDGPETLESHSVYFGNDLNYPSCTCNDWKMNSLPCQHMFAVFLKYDQFNYTSLSSIYRASPIFDLDYSCLRKVETESGPKSISTQTDSSIFKKTIPFDSITLNKIKKLRNALKSTASLFTDKLTLERITSELMNMERNFTHRMNPVNINTMKNIASKQNMKISSTGSNQNVGPGLGKVIPASSITIPSHTQQQQHRTSSSSNSNILVDNTLHDQIGFIQDPSSNVTATRPESSAAKSISTTSEQSGQSYKIVLQSDKLSTLSPHDIVNQLKQSIKLRKAVSSATTASTSSRTTTTLQEHARAIIMSLNGEENGENIAENTILHQEEQQDEFKNVVNDGHADILISQNHETVINNDELPVTATDLSAVGSLLLGLGADAMAAEVHDGEQTAAMVATGQKRKMVDHDETEKDVEVKSGSKKSNLNED